jgi:hypothetical protein
VQPLIFTVTVYVPGQRFDIEGVVCPPGDQRKVAPGVVTFEFAVPSHNPKHVTFVEVGLTTKLTGV